ncbi:MAG: mRNA surveillance protein pelota [Candidatus Lokiarchaeota archaeon]|nr:mRNA surveillance protein pelota [Candidatus Harpocratesius repetitus]
MQILKNNTRNGELLVQIDSLDDLWILYNIILPGDQIKGRTVRRVVLREGDPGQRKPMTLLITVEKIEFHEFTNRLRVTGVILEGPEDYVSHGQHHTFNLEPGHQIRIFKEKWFRNDIERIRRSMTKKDTNQILVVAIENGLANIAVLSNYSLTPIVEINENIPGKRYKKQMHKAAVESFYGQVYNVLRENCEKLGIGFIAICGPGFEKEHFSEYFHTHHDQHDYSVEIRVINASSGELSAVYEILRNGSLAALKTDFKLAQDEMIMAKFIEHLGKDNGTAVYGLKQTALCSQMGAVEDLLICDVLLRSANKEKRQQIEDALNNTEAARGTVHILSTMNPAGEQLQAYGQIAAILRYKVDL